jgi:DNA-binding HxlR family transcriptional regulator
MVLFDILGERWTLRIMWELKSAPATLRELQDRCGAVSPTVMNRRIKSLTESKLITHAKGEGYSLTPLACGLIDHLGPLDQWAQKWAETLD